MEFRHASDKLNYNFLYAWGRSTGNFEGAVKSDIVQTDHGITTDFDFPALMDGADGYLPNDRRHVFKFYGTYRWMNNHLIAGWNASLVSGRPINIFGIGYPDTGTNVTPPYGDTFYLFTNSCNNPAGVAACTPMNEQADKIYRFQSRGTNGRTPWTVSLDASLTYNFNVSNIDMTASLQVFNLLNIQEPTSINEHAEARRSEGTPNEWYGAVYGWQQPRHIRFSIQARF